MCEGKTKPDSCFALSLSHLREYFGSGQWKGSVNPAVIPTDCLHVPFVEYFGAGKLDLFGRMLSWKLYFTREPNAFWCLMGDTRVSVAGFGVSGGVKRRALRGDAQIRDHSRCSQSQAAGACRASAVLAQRAGRGRLQSLQGPYVSRASHTSPVKGTGLTGLYPYCSAQAGGSRLVLLASAAGRIFNCC